MKKNWSKKLTLQRETLVNLQNKDLENVNGGYPTEISCENSCDTATRWACSKTTC